MSYSKPSKRKRVDFPINEQTQSMESTDVIDLNVGGHYVTTTRDTIRKHKSNLEQMISNPKKDKDGRIFIEFDYEIFKHVLEFLKRDTLPPKSMAMRVYNYAKELELYELQTKLALFSNVKLRLDFEMANPNKFSEWTIVKNIVENVRNEEGLHVFNKSIGEIPKETGMSPEWHVIIPTIDTYQIRYIAYCLHELGYVVFYADPFHLDKKKLCGSSDIDSFIVFRSDREYWQAYFREKRLKFILVED